MSGLNDADEKLFAELRAALHITIREGKKVKCLLVGPPMDGLLKGPNANMWGHPVRRMMHPGAGVVTMDYQSPV